MEIRKSIHVVPQLRIASFCKNLALKLPYYWSKSGRQRSTSSIFIVLYHTSKLPSRVGCPLTRNLSYATWDFLLSNRTMGSIRLLSLYRRIMRLHGQKLPDIHRSIGDRVRSTNLFQYALNIFTDASSL